GGGGGVGRGQPRRPRPQPGRHHPGDRGVAPDADDQAGSYTAHETERAAEPASERDRAARHPPRAPTADLASGKEVEGAARCRDQACLESLRGAGEGDAETTLDERRSERQRGKDVPSRAAAGDQDVQTPTAHPDSRASAISAPSSASETIIAEPPYDTNGRVSPLVGSAPSATPMLSSPCTTMRLVNPKARSEPNSSGWRAAMRRPRNATSAKSARTTPAPTRPSSSPITEKMKSVCAAGREYIFCCPCPSPTPGTPAEPKAMSAWQRRKPSRNASWLQSRNEVSRFRRYGAVIAKAARAGAAAAANTARCARRAPAAKSISTSRIPQSATVPKSGSSRQSAASIPTTMQCGTMPCQNSRTRSPRRASD